MESKKDRWHALALAKRVHEGDTRWDGGDYFENHVKRVADSAADVFGLDSDEVIVALLHDTVEDHPERLSIDTIEVDFGVTISEAVYAMTKVEARDYATYLQELAENPLARRVKVLDIQDNLADLHLLAKDHRQRKDKYGVALLYLASQGGLMR